jgi:hypothetical protein
MPGLRIDRLDLATVTFGRSRVEQPPAGLPGDPLDLAGGRNQSGPHLRREPALGDPLRARSNGPAFRMPFRKPSVEDSHGVVSEPPKHPP